jgi:hypothetical protein
MTVKRRAETPMRPAKGATNPIRVARAPHFAEPIGMLNMKAGKVDTAELKTSSGQMRFPGRKAEVKVAKNGARAGKNRLRTHWVG